jgi:hypothetical protein
MASLTVRGWQSLERLSVPFTVTSYPLDGITATDYDVGMIKTSINAACKRRGIMTAYQLGKLTGLYPAGAARLFNDDLTKIDLDTLDRLIRVLSTQPVKKPKVCKISELFVVVDNGE